MAGNKGLRAANKNKNDEFYTQLSDIENEMRYYKRYFKNKVILCNCDDPYESNFFKYFAMNFNYLQIKKLIAISYIGSPILGTQLSLLDVKTVTLVDRNVKHPYKIEINEVTDENNDGVTDLIDVEILIKNKKNILTLLDGDGDFRSEESVDCLKEADVVITNPPFSLFREYLEQLVEYDKKYIIIGNTNSLTYKEVFKLIKEDRLRTGYTNFNRGMYFYVPEETEKYHKVEDDKKLVRVSTSCWFTNLPVNKHKEQIALYKEYTPEEFPKYYNFDAINIGTYTDIPYDYDGFMGVPITFLDKYNPEQFEIVGLGISNSGIDIGVKPYTDEHKRYRKTIDKKGAVNGDLYLLDGNGNPKVPYARVIIKRKDINLRSNKNVNMLNSGKIIGEKEIESEDRVTSNIN